MTDEFDVLVDRPVSNVFKLRDTALIVEYHMHLNCSFVLREFPPSIEPLLWDGLLSVYPSMTSSSDSLAFQVLVYSTTNCVECIAIRIVCAATADFVSV